MKAMVYGMNCKEGVTEQLKAENPMLWVGRMNEIQTRAREIVDMEIIYIQSKGGRKKSSCRFIFLDFRTTM